MFSRSACACYLVTCAICFPVAAETDEDESLPIREEMVVSAPFSKAHPETALPVEVLSGEELNKRVTGTLGETLKNQLGVHSASFGPGVGLPIIRGQSSSRVQVLQNGLNISDVSTRSPDHANSLEPSLSERIEIIRGPATLLYGNGAIGGVVNVIDGRIPESSYDKTEFILEYSRGMSVIGNRTAVGLQTDLTNADQAVFKLGTSFGPLNLHIDAFIRDNDDIEIDGFAIDEASLEVLEERLGHNEEEEEEIVNSNGFIANSDAEASGATFGLSLTGERGFIGAAVNVFNNDYGLPPGSHVHAHGHEEHGHEEHGHEEHGHEEEGHEHAEEEEGQAFVRIDMEQLRFDLRGGLDFDDSWVQQIRGYISYTDYEHDEIEIEASGESIAGTLFQNEGLESRFTLTHKLFGDAWTGVIGLQYTDSEFEAIGEEAFIPRTEESRFALFLVERLETGRFTWEFGARVESIDLEPAGCSASEQGVTASASLLADVTADSNVMVALSHSERAPAVEERYSNINAGNCTPLAEDDQVLHAATALFEAGDPDLGLETSLNVELGYRKYFGNWNAEFSIYHNEISDYIYLSLVDDERGFYTAEDATFFGIEGKIGIPILKNSAGETEIGFRGDYVEAEFSNGDVVPRIPAGRLGLHLSHFTDRWSFDVGLTHIFSQDEIAFLETKTPDSTRLEVYGDYRWQFKQGSELVLFFRGTNLLDEALRNHTSFLKHYVPEPGRGVKVGLRFTL